MLDNQKQELIQAIFRESEALGSNAAVARKCGVSEATISQIISGTYSAKGDEMYYKIAASLNVSFTESDWNIVETRNYKMITTTLNDARFGAKFKAVSEKAGSGKTTTARYYANQNPQTVFYLQCREWSRSKFIEQLMRLLGLTPTVSVDDCVEQSSEFFNRKSKDKPLLIIDEADKLKPSAIRMLIPLYNECEGRLGVCIFGTDNLEKEFKRGVKYNQKGYDELMSRFGRGFVHLVGEDLKSVVNICKANGITDPSVANAIFKECDTQSVAVGNVYQQVVKDLRQVKSKIEGKKLLMTNNRPALDLAMGNVMEVQGA